MTDDPQVQAGSQQRPPRTRPRRTRVATGEQPKLVAKMVYLPEEEAAALERESQEAGRSGISAQIRWILTERRRKIKI